jgi:acyl carrier protein
MLRMDQSEALHWIAELFEETAAGILPDTPRDAIPNWDSLGVLTLMAGLSEQFDITVNADELAGMQRVDDVLAVLRRHGKLH